MFCQNCGAPGAGFCSACQFLAQHGKRRMWGETEGLVNRRWQMRFNRGELPDVDGDGGMLWERKRAVQDW